MKKLKIPLDKEGFLCYNICHPLNIVSSGFRIEKQNQENFKKV